MSLKLMKAFRIVCGTLALLSGSGLMAMNDSDVVAQAVDSLKAGDRVVFLGDSLTQQGGHPTGYVTLFKNALAENDLSDVTVINAGISGHKVPDLQKRLSKDVLEHNPTHVVIYIGINDVWHSLKGNGTKPELFEAGLKDLIARITATGARVILCTPSVIGEQAAGTNPLDEMLEQFSSVSRKVASETDASLLDLRKRFVDHLQNINTENVEKGVLTGDGVHFNEQGNRFLADQMLAAFGVGSKEAEQDPLLRHVVLFQFKESATDAQVSEIVDAFAALPDKIDTIVDFEHGTNVSPENLDQGFTHCFVVTFKDEAGRDVYLPHPAHKEFVSLIKGKIEQVLVVDYLSGN
jgi:lysophospholipase L1-like esterase